MQHFTPTQLDAAYRAVAHPDPELPLSARQSAWETLMAARGKRCDFDAPADRASVVTVFDIARRARVSARIAAHCADRGYPYSGPFDGDAA